MAHRPTCATVQKMGSLIYFGLLISSLIDRIEGYDMSLNGNAVRNQPLEIHMNIGTINTAIGLNRPDGSIAGTCAAPIGGVSGGCSAGLTQDLTTGVTTFSIALVSRTTDQGLWTSQHGGAEKGNISIAVLSVPTSVTVSQTISSLTLSDGTSNIQTLTVIVACAYPDVSLGLEYVPQGGGTTVSASSSTSTCTSTGNSGCTDPQANGYTCTITPQYEAGLVAGTKYNIHVTVNLDGQYQSIGLNDTITDTDITVQANPSPNCDCTPEQVLLALSIVIMCIVLIHSWMVFFYTKGIINWNVPVISKCDDDKSPVNIIVVTIAITLFCVLGVVLCAVGLHISLKCTLEDNTSLILTIVGFVLVVVGLVLDILHVCLFKKKTAKCDQRNRPDGQEANPFKAKEALPSIEDKSTNNSARSGSPTSASKIRTKINKMSGQVSDSNESDGGETARSKLGNVPVGRKLPPIQPGAEPSQPPEDTTGVKKLKKKKRKKNKEEQQNDKVMQVQHTGNAFNDVDINLPHQVPVTSLHSQTPEGMKFGTQPPDTDNVSFQNVISNQKDLIWIGQQTKPIYALAKLTMRWETNTVNVGNRH